VLHDRDHDRVHDAFLKGARLFTEGLQEEGAGEAAAADQVLDQVLAAHRDAVRVIAAYRCNGLFSFCFIHVVGP
jgi:hypothetical protein